MRVRIDAVESTPQTRSGFTLIELLVVVSCRGTSVWRCPAQTDPVYVAETPWAWDTSVDYSRWRGSYSYAPRTRNITTGAISFPPNCQYATGPSPCTHPWPGLKITDGNYVYAFTVTLVISVFSPSCFWYV